MSFAPITARITDMSVRAADPTGLSSVTGRLVIIAGLVAVLVLLIMQWRRRR